MTVEMVFAQGAAPEGNCHSIKKESRKGKLLGNRSILMLLDPLNSQPIYSLIFFHSFFYSFLVKFRNQITE